MNRDDIIRMAREAGAIPIHERPKELAVVGNENIERFAALVAAAEAKRADALAATIAALRDIVTSDAESKAEFIARVRNVLGACPDQRVLHAVEAEREACAQILDGVDNYANPMTANDCAAAIRARGQA